MNFNAILKKNFIKYDNVEKLHFEIVNIVNLAANQTIFFTVIAKNLFHAVAFKENVHYVNFAACFLQKMQLIRCPLKNFY